MEPRSTSVDIEYEKRNVTSVISSYLESFDYTDPADGESDSISLRIKNTDKRWIGSWMPVKGDKIKAAIIKNVSGKSYRNGCGLFTIDDISFSSSPLIGSIGAVSIPVDEDFKATKRSKAWSNVTLEEVAKDISKRANISLIYDADEIKLKSLEQSENNDCSFLTSLCEEYGLSLKVYSNKIIIFDDSRYECKESVLTITEEDMQSWSYNTTLTGTYTGAKLSYSDPENDETYTVNVGGGKRILEINTKADNKKDAELKALAKVNLENKKMTTMSVQLKIGRFISSGSVVTIQGLKKLDGRYYVTKVKHSISSGYKVSLELRKIVDRIITEYGQRYDSASSRSDSYTVVKGDCLWNIAKKYYGSGAYYKKIYDANKEVIEKAAVSRGLSSSNKGNLIFPGTQLIIP